MRSVNQLALQQIGKRFNQHSELESLCKTEKGWIHQMRTTLGMTLKKLGEVCGISTPTIAQAEAREIDGRITIETLRKIAEAMNCEVTYAFIPKSNMKDFVENAAYEKAKRILNTADLHMSLENQKVTSEIEFRINKLKDKLLQRGDVW